MKFFINTNLTFGNPKYPHTQVPTAENHVFEIHLRDRHIFQLIFFDRHRSQIKSWTKLLRVLNIYYVKFDLIL
jgi:hypothetical protein